MVDARTPAPGVAPLKSEVLGSASAKSPSWQFRPDVEGLRAVAVVLVVAYHAGVDRIAARFGFDALAGGFIGVDVFFVISGFLITGLLISETERTGSLSLGGFYARRARRILPAAVVVLLSTLAATVMLLPRIDQARAALDAVSAAFYVSNYRFAAQTDYFAGGAEDSPFLHFWSLSVEEQFYLLWPGLILLLAVRSARSRLDMRRRLGILIVGVLVTSFTASVIVTGVSAPWAFFGLPTRAWELATGAILALFLSRLRDIPKRLGVLLGWLGIATILVSSVVIGPSTPFPGWAAAAPVVGTAMVIAGGARKPRRGVGKVLSLPAPAYLGRVSYVWYLWHWPFIVLAGPATGATGRPVAAVVLAAVALSLIAAIGTHHLIEAPLHRNTSLLRPRSAIALAVASTGVVVTAAVPVAAPWNDMRSSDATTAAGARLDQVRDASGCIRGTRGVSADPCEFGHPDASTTVALVGDSHAVHMLPALQGVAAEQKWRVLLFAKAACPPVDVRRWLSGYNREYFECAEWREAVADRIQDEDVDIVFFSRIGVYKNTLIDASGARIENSAASETWREGTQRTLNDLATDGRRFVFLRDVPNPGFDVPSCVSASDGDASQCKFSLGTSTLTDSTLHEGEIAAARGRDDALFVDLADSICTSEPCTVEDESGVIKYRDDNHLTATFSATLAEPLASALRTAGLTGS